MIFVGDIALPFKNAVEIKNIPNSFKGKNWFGNLEGAIVDSTIGLQELPIVFNQKDAVEDLLSKYNFKGFALANNHFFDIGSFQDSVRVLNELNVPFVGAGENIDTAGRPLLIEENENKIVILNFGWEVIQCEVANIRKTGVNPLKKDHVIKTVKKALRDFPEAAIVPYFHWSYELEGEPQPFERELARSLIKIGVAGVIGTHPHRVGGFEIYEGKPIVYSLGNWMFKQCFYRNGKSKFPDFCNLELAFEWDFHLNKFLFHFFRYNRDSSVLEYIKSEGEDSDTLKELTPFANFTNSKYKKWYKKNHFHKGKGLPIYYYNDSKFQIYFKNMWNKGRDQVVKLVSTFR